MFNKKSKKSSKPHSKHLVFGIPTNIAVGPLGFQANVDTDSAGERLIVLIVIKVHRADSSDPRRDGPSTFTNRIY